MFSEDSLHRSDQVLRQFIFRWLWLVAHSIQARMGLVVRSIIGKANCDGGLRNNLDGHCE